MKKVIDDLYLAYQQEQDKKSEEIKRNENELLARATLVGQEVMKQAGLDWLLPFGEYRIEKDSAGNVCFVWEVFSHCCSELEITPIKILAKFFPIKEEDELAAEIITDYRGDWRSIPTESLLIEARKYYETYKVEEIEHKVNETNQESGYALDPRRNNYEDLARKLHKQLCEIDPARFDKWDQALNIFLKTKKDDEEEKIKNEKEKEKYNIMLSEYEDAFRTWFITCLDIHAHNKSVVSEVQNLFNDPMDLYKLTYALVAQDDEENEDITINTKEVFVKNKGSKNNVFEFLDGKFVRFFNPVSIVKMRIRATEEKAASIRLWFEYVTPILDNHNIAYLPCQASEDEIYAALIEHGFTLYPDVPVVNDNLKFSDTINVRNMLMEEYLG